jgi:anti-sigma factor RsiW
MTAPAVPELACQDLVEAVTDYLEEALADTDRVRFDAHLAQCPDCAEYLHQMRRTVAALGSLPVEELDPAIVRSLPARPGGA